MRNHSKEQDALQALKQFRIIYGSVRQHFREVEKTCGISGSQLWILQEVSRSTGIGVSELAGKLSVHQSTCSLLVEKLVTKKLILKERSKEDQRRVGLYVTKEAERILQLAPGPAEGVLPEALSALPQDVLLSLNSALGQVIDQLQISDEKLAEKPLSDL